MITDVRHACRMLAKMPLLAAVVIVSLGIGIGANTIVFSWIQSVVFKPIPAVRDSGSYQLIQARTDTGIYLESSWPEYRDLRERLRTVRDLLAFRMAPLYVGEPGHIERGNGLLVSSNYFPALGLEPALGRFFGPEETDTRSGPVIVISYDYWQTRFAGAADAVGRTLRVNGQDLTIVGVAPRGFQGTIMRLTFDMWLPAPLAPMLFTGSREIDDRGDRGYMALGRLAPDATRAAAQADLDGLMRDLAVAFPKTNTGVRGELLSFWQAPRGPQRFLATSLAVLQAITLLLLLAVCGNTANLVLARASTRRQEMAVRLALGAKRWHVARLLLVENVLLATCGALLGAGLAVWGTNALSAVPPMRVRGIPISLMSSVDGSGLMIAIALGIACGCLFGLAPALQLARVDPQQLRTGSSTPARTGLRNLLMAIETALAVIVLIVAGSFFRSFFATRTLDTGFTRDGVLLAAYDLSGRTRNDTSARQFASRLLAKVRGLPAVSGAAIASGVPLDIHGLPVRFVTIDGRPRSENDPDRALTMTVTPGYFDVMRIAIVRGTDFADLDDVAAAPQAVVNEELVQRYLGGGEPLGRRIQVRGRNYVVTGVVRNSLYNAFGEPPTPIVYLSYRDVPASIGEIHLRARHGSERALAGDVRRAVAELDPELPVYDVRTLDDHIESNLIFRRIPARMFAVLGPLLLVLASIGIYAVVAYTIAQRTKEIGVRLALGATTRRVVAEHVGESLLVVGSGALLGWMIAFAGAMLGTSESVDPMVFGLVPALLLLVATLACWIPSRRAARVDPVVALRTD
ncbi:MAG TPA: ABC transporter permease [Vicinamibacterales bacterium]